MASAKDYFNAAEKWLAKAAGHAPEHAAHCAYAAQVELEAAKFALEFIVSSSKSALEYDANVIS